MRPTLGEYLDALAETGMTRSGIGRAYLDDEGWEESLARVEAAGVELTYLGFRVLFELDKPETWDDQRALLRKAIDAADRYDNRIYGVTGAGPAVGLTWGEACEAFVRAVAPAAEYARAQGVRLMIEPTLPLFSDIHFVHSLRETVDVAEAANLDVCFEVNACWNERGLDETIARAGTSIGLAQLSDWVPGWRTIDRAVPGEGVVDLERVVRSLLDAGFDGSFDLELWGDAGMPDVEAVRRGAAYLSELLERLGV